jgi:replication factor A1
MTPSFDDLLDQILSSNPKIARDELLSMMEKKKQESHGLLSNEGAIRLLAQQLSTTGFPILDLKDQRIMSVHAGFNDVTITGQIVSVSDVREFQRADRSQGKVLKARVADGSGQITCVFWDAMADNFAREALASGSSVRILHGYTKYGLAGEVEFHLGSRASIQILTRGDSSSANRADTLSGVSKSLGGSDEFRVQLVKLQKSQSGNGPTWALCAGESGLIIGKFWDEHARDVLSLGEGSIVSIQNSWVTERNGLVYLNVGSKSSVKKESADLVSETSVAAINVLKPSPVLWTVAGTVVERGDVRDIQTREGRRTRVSNIMLEDGTGKLRVSLWDVHAQKTESLRIGDVVRLVGIKVRENMNGEIEASTVFLTQLEKA